MRGRPRFFLDGGRRAGKLGAWLGRGRVNLEASIHPRGRPKMENAPFPPSKLKSSILKDPFYLREVGHNRGRLRLIKITGVVTVLVAYGIWFFFWRSGKDWGELAIAIPAYGSLVLCLMALVLAMRSVDIEVSRDTAEALVMTPAPRERVVWAKVLGALEPLAPAALLLWAFYFVALPTVRGNFAATDILHGGLLRLEAVGPLPDKMELAYSGVSGDLASDAVVACGAVISDFSWYFFLAAFALYMRTTFRHMPLAPFIMSFIFLCLFALLEAQLSNMVLISGARRMLGVWPHYCFGWARGDRHVTLIFRGGWSLIFWTVLLWSVMILLRYLAARFMLRRAAKNFDRIATGASGASGDTH